MDHELQAAVADGKEAMSTLPATEGLSLSRIRIHGICHAYESGYGRGHSERDLTQPYEPESPEGIAYHEGWAFGRSRARYERQQSPEPSGDALTILRTLMDSYELGDLVYDVREREGLGWEGPKVKAYSNAVTAAKELLKAQPTTKVEK